MAAIDALAIKKENLKKGIIANLDLLMGTIVRAPSHSGYYLTDKREGKTITKYIRKSVLHRADEMTNNNKQLKKMARQLSEINWQLLQHGAM
ncbi:MAG: hypothetical protein JXN60_02465 [Lentisphaerae bacterium]|nr:hypothetical protein [Lentisphaerota bacterium]